MKDQALIDNLIIKRHGINLSMEWADYWKSYDMILQSWILRRRKRMEEQEIRAALYGML